MNAQFQPGETVFHKTFGQGLVVSSQTTGSTQHVQVNFAGDTKPLLGQFLTRRAEDVERVFMRAQESGTPRAEPKQRVAKHKVTDPLPTVTVASFHGKQRPKREFLDEAELIPMKNVTLLFGDGGTGKSLLALQLSCGTAITGQWIGMRVRKGPVLYVSAEDDEEETHIRSAEIAQGEGFSLENGQDLHIAVLAGGDTVLANEDMRSATLAWTALYDRLLLRMAAVRPLLLVIDNLVDAFAGNQNATHLARQFIGKLRALAIEYRCAIVILAHPSQSGMTTGDGNAGARAWGNSARSRLYFHREVMEDGSEPSPNRRSLDTKKSNYGPTGGTISLEWQDGRFIRTDLQASPAGSFDGVAKLAKAERVFLALLRWHMDKKTRVSNNRSVTYAPSLFSRHRQSEGVRKHEFAAAMEALLDRGEIAVLEHGPPSSKRTHLGFPIDLEEAGR